MIEVSKETQEAYLTDSIGKDLLIYFPEINVSYTGANLVAESMEINESILSSNSIEFVGCIASFFKVQIINTKEQLKGKKIEVSIRDHITNTKINLFHGVVESAEQEANHSIKTIEAYDALYSLGNVDVTDWYNSHGETTQYELLKDLLRKVGINQQYSYLANGNMPAFCGTKRRVSKLSALDLLKQLCQASGGFGKINREGAFQVLYIGEITKPAWYPSKNLFPSKNIYPTKYAQSVKANIPDTKPDYYTEAKYEDFTVVPIQKVVVRDSEEDAETTYGTGENKYIVQGNLLIADQTEQNLNTITRNIYLKVKGISYVPFTAKNNGLPFLECGDYVLYDDIDIDTGHATERRFLILNRSLKGIQALKDSYEAQGTEYQNVFITDLQAQLDNLKKKQNSDYNKTDDEVAELKRKVSRLEALVQSSIYQIDKPMVQKVVKQSVVNKDSNFVIDDFIVGVENE